MSIRSIRVRRTMTAAGAVAAIVIGFAAIQAAAAWAANAAPLMVTPLSATSIEARLVDEQARSAALEAQLTDLADNSRRLAAALETAQAQIDTDAQHAAALEQDLQDAKRKLAALKRSIRLASNQSTVVGTTRVVATTTSTSGGDDGGREGGGDD